MQFDLYNALVILVLRKKVGVGWGWLRKTFYKRAKPQGSYEYFPKFLKYFTVSLSVKKICITYIEH